MDWSKCPNCGEENWTIVEHATQYGTWEIYPDTDAEGEIINAEADNWVAGDEEHDRFECSRCAKRLPGDYAGELLRFL